MQFKIFTIPIGDNGSALQEMNAFLRGNKIMEVENKLMGNDNGAYWCFCVRYIERAYGVEGAEKKGVIKVDYRTANRNNNNPDNRNNNYGFRLVFVP